MEAELEASSLPQAGVVADFVWIQTLCLADCFELSLYDAAYLALA